MDKFKILGMQNKQDNPVISYLLISHYFFDSFAIWKLVGYFKT